LSHLDRCIREVALLHESNRIILSTGDLDTVLHQILLIVRNYFSVFSCGIFLRDEAGQELYLRAGLGYGQTGLRVRIGVDGVVGQVAQTGEMIYLADVTREPRYIAGNPQVRSELALPLLVRNEVFGVLDIESEQPDSFSEGDIQLLNAFASQAAIAIENTRLYTAERRRMHQIELLNLIARSATSAASTHSLLASITDLVHDSFDSANVAMLLAESDGTLSLKTKAGAREPARLRFTKGQRQALLGSSDLWLDTSAQKEKWPGVFGEPAQELDIPLVCVGEILGLLAIAPPESRPFTADDRSIAQATADVSATAIRNMRLSEELTRVAHTDFLTGVYNQRYFHVTLAHELARSRRYKKNCGIGMLDLESFRLVNSEVGFDRGDELLRDLARALQKRTRSNDVVCRYAGDRFAMIFPEIGTQGASTVMEKVLSAVGTTTYGREKKPLQAAWGMSIFPTDGDSEVELVRSVLERVREAKRSRVAASS